MIRSRLPSASQCFNLPTAWLVGTALRDALGAQGDATITVGDSDGVSVPQPFVLDARDVAARREVIGCLEGSDSELDRNTAIAGTSALAAVSEGEQAEYCSAPPSPAFQTHISLRHATTSMRYG